MLTSLDQNDLKIRHCVYVEKLVILSPKEVVYCEKFKKLIIVTPGIRLLMMIKMIKRKAIKNGSSLLIIGRTITKSMFKVN